MKIVISKYPIASLIILAILCGVLWRLEIEYHGWAGLIWLSYFHLAVPMACGLFLLWANQLMDVNWKKRIFINLTLIVYGVLIYQCLVTALTYFFATGPFGFLLELQTSSGLLSLLRYSIIVLIPFIPVGAYLLLWAFRIQPPLKFLLFSTIGIIISIPLSVTLLEVIDHKGGADAIHSVKSGMLVPFWIFSMGWLWSGKNKGIGTST